MIKHSGIIRKMDDLGRIVIPKEMRNSMDIKEGDSYEISCIDNGFIIEKYIAGETPKEVKEEDKKEKILVEIKKEYDNYFTYLKVSERMWEFLEWLHNEGLLDNEVVFEEIREVPVIEF